MGMPRYPHRLQMVLAASRRNPSWTYTIGYTEHYGHAEVVASNVHPLLLNDLADLIQAGHRFEDGARLEGLLRDPVIFRRVPPELHGPEVTVCTQHYKGRPFELLQMVWPDYAGKFPWEKGYSTVAPQHQLWRRGGARGHGRLIQPPPAAPALPPRAAAPWPDTAAPARGVRPPPRPPILAPLSDTDARNRASLERALAAIETRLAVRWDRQPYVEGVH
jgi:hypothetical protein